MGKKYKNLKYHLIISGHMSLISRITLILFFFANFIRGTAPSIGGIEMIMMLGAFSL
tara:strand:+ start:346 stop:516 length:171 start_codon:yes stop_codon:yes gene_type:complete